MIDTLVAARDPFHPDRSVECHRVCYVHIPRVANTFYHLLAGLYPTGSRLTLSEYRGGIDRWSPGRVQSAQFFAGQFRLADAQQVLFTDTHFLTFLQHPADRLAAEYVTSLGPDEIDEANGASFSEWLATSAPPAASYRSNLQTWILGAPTDPAELGIDPEHITPDGFDTLLARAKGRLTEEFAFFGMVEHYLASLHLFSWTFGIDAFAFDHADLADRSEHADQRMLDPGRVQALVDEPAHAAIDQLSWADVELHRHATKLFQSRHAAMLAHLADTEPQDLPDLPLAADGLELRAGVDLAPILGFHPLEETPDGACWYWTGAQDSATLSIPLDLSGHDRVAFELRARAAASPEAWSELVVLLDGRPLRVVARGASSEGLVFVGIGSPVPRHAGHHELELFGPLAPSPEATDPRLLGIAVEGIVLRAREIGGLDADSTARPHVAGLDRTVDGSAIGTDVAQAAAPAAASTPIARARRFARRIIRGAQRRLTPSPAPRTAAAPTRPESAEASEASGSSGSSAPGRYAALDTDAVSAELASTRRAIAAVWEAQGLLRDASIRATDLDLRLRHLERQLAAAEPAPGGPDGEHNPT